jgi:hypothetical protein
LERAVPVLEVTVEQFGDFAGGAWFLNFVQRSRNVIAETTIRVRSLLHWGRIIFEATAIRGLEEDTRNGKGCDIGYALAASSCEGANSVEACTVTALDAITAFAVPNPNCSSQSRRFFQVWLLFGLPRRADHSAYFGLAKV